MLALDTRLRPNEEEVAAKVMDGEAIVINLATGSYYSMPGVGGVIWESIEQHCSLAEIAAQVCSSYDVSAETARADVLDMATKLLAEGIVKLSTRTAATGSPAARPAQQPYETPSVSVYSDMRNLLALDPPVPSIDALGAAPPKGDPSNE